MTFNKDPRQHAKSGTEGEDVQKHCLDWKQDRSGKEKEQNQDADHDPQEDPRQSPGNGVLGVGVVSSDSTNESSFRRRYSANIFDQALAVRAAWI